VSHETTDATGLAGRYASALFDLASESDALDAVAADLRTLAGLIGESADLRRLIRSPVIDRADQRRGIIAVLEEGKAAPLTVRFAGMVAANRRLYALPEMIAAYLSMLAEKRGEVSAEVRSARPLSERQLGDISQALKGILGATVALTAKVDPALIGGLVVRVGSRMFDSSINTKLQRLRLAMKGVG
jgi:F-type H+-transporting ATPase subunit delta